MIQRSCVILSISRKPYIQHCYTGLPMYGSKTVISRTEMEHPSIKNDLPKKVSMYTKLWVWHITQDNWLNKRIPTPSSSTSFFSSSYHKFYPFYSYLGVLELIGLDLFFNTHNSWYVSRYWCLWKNIFAAQVRHG